MGGLVDFLSGESTSKTLLPTFSWNLARGSTGSGLPEFVSRNDRSLSYVLLGLLAFFSGRLVVFHVFREVGVEKDGASFSCLLFLLNGLLLKKPLLFFWISLAGLYG